MRTAFINALCSLAEHDPRIWLVTGDLGYSVLETFAERFPDRFLNVGVAEQNMTGVAAGLAMSGYTVFTYSIANFPIMRCLEQIRNDICYHKANVKIVAVGGGLAYGTASYTHHAIEDLAVMRALPNMTVLAPGDPVETRLATEALVRLDGPGYLRLGKAGEPTLHQQIPAFCMGQAILVRNGVDVTLMSTGGMLKTILDAADSLEQQGIHARVVSMVSLKPLDKQAILTAAGQTKAIITVEEHSIIGGLGSAVAEVLAEEGCGVRFKRLGLSETLSYAIGSQNYLLEQQHLTALDIATNVIQLINTL